MLEIENKYFWIYIIWVIVNYIYVFKILKKFEDKKEGILTKIFWLYVIGSFGIIIFWCSKCVINSDYENFGIRISEMINEIKKLLTINTFILILYIAKEYIKYFRKDKVKSTDYCREIPDGLEKSYSALYYCSNISKKKLNNGIIGAYILKWSLNDNIEIIDNDKYIWQIDLKSNNFGKNEIEQQLYDMMKVAAKDNKVDKDEFIEWSRKNKKKLERWYFNILNYAQREKQYNIVEELDPQTLNAIGKIYEGNTDQEKAEIIQNTIMQKRKYNMNKGVTNDEKELTKKLLGLKEFLKDYSLIDEKKHIEVKIWEQYLIYAQLLGITKKVNKQMKDIYPESFRLKYDSLDFIVNTYLSTILGIIFFGVIFMLAIMLSIVPYIYLKFLMEMNII